MLKLRIQKILLLFILATGALQSFACPMPFKVKDTIIKTTPPLRGFYSKYLNCEGIPIRSSSVVDDKALFVASGKIKRMLAHMPAATKQLVKTGAELHIIGKNQQTSDLPEFRDQKGVKFMDNGIMTDIDQRTRGMGGLLASCGEENLLTLPGDRYGGGSDICFHEFAHTIMNYGLDNALREKIIARHKQALAEGLWKGAYAGSNPDEYWAELSMWYFDKHGEFLRDTKLPVAGAEGLKAYDAAGYALLDSIYSGKLQPKEGPSKASAVVQKGDASVDSPTNAQLLLINDSPRKIKLYWIDFEGKPVFYKEVEPKARYTQPTFMQHVWLVEDADKTTLVYIRVRDEQCEINIVK
ncbi:hypothetical protein [Mucilaginibacter sp.]|uniref:VHL beta domain-containing protein n=1 Tax=Mucilaginibacter sp. TaxID=1882438 RepID=UPI003263E6B8